MIVILKWNDMNMQAFDQHRSEKEFLKAVYNFQISLNIKREIFIINVQNTCFKIKQSIGNLFPFPKRLSQFSPSVL